MLLIKYDIMLISTWIPIKTNELVDDLSRFRYRKIANKYSQLRYLIIASLSQNVIHLKTNINKHLCQERQLVFSNKN